jgi:hypothetical protein
MEGQMNIMTMKSDKDLAGEVSRHNVSSEKSEMLTSWH